MEREVLSRGGGHEMSAPFGAQRLRGGKSAGGKGASEAVSASFRSREEGAFEGGDLP